MQAPTVWKLLNFNHTAAYCSTVGHNDHPAIFNFAEIANQRTLKPRNMVFVKLKTILLWNMFRVMMCRVACGK